MNIKDTFILLTSQTYPYGYEEQLLHFLPKGYKMDIDGNYYYEVGTGSKNIFACHLDTACKLHTDVTHKFDGKYIRTNGKTVLGADDKAGMTILLYMIEKNVPGLYYFFVGEECGCIGSTAAAKRTEFFSNYNKIVSFDRRGTTSIITHQSSRRSCSDEFANSLSKEYAKYGMNLEKDDTGVYTDSAEFTEIITECTNISVGYYKEHTHDEYQDIEFLENIAKASAVVDWDSLEIKRDPNEREYKQWNYYRGGTTSTRSTSSWRDDEYEYCPKRSRRGRNKGNKGYSSGEVINTHYNSGSWNNFRANPIDEDFVADKYKSGKKSKVYYNEIDNELLDNNFKDNVIILDNSHITDYYKGVRPLFLDDNLSFEEFRIIKEQCLNMNDESDRDFAKFMESNLGSVNNI